MLLGSQGSGKTTTAQALAFDSYASNTRLRLSVVASEIAGTVHLAIS